jgi:hypothetical protein
MMVFWNKIDSFCNQTQATWMTCIHLIEGLLNLRTRRGVDVRARAEALKL